VTYILLLHSILSNKITIDSPLLILFIHHDELS